MHLHSRKAALALSSFITSLYFRSKCDGQTNVIRLLQDSNLTLFTLKKVPKVLYNKSRDHMYFESIICNSFFHMRAF